MTASTGTVVGALASHCGRLQCSRREKRDMKPAHEFGLAVQARKSFLKNVLPPVYRFFAFTTFLAIPLVTMAFISFSGGESFQNFTASDGFTRFLYFFSKVAVLE